LDKEIWVDFSEWADESYKELQKKVLEEREKEIENSLNTQLLKAINREIQNLKIDPQRGTHISRKNMSKAVIERYGTDRLWKIDLVGYWRLIYTITGDDVKVIAFILEFFDHKEYDKVFGYKKK
tara:strand:- start:321 stop:692 length:372 start_codon:yes stop_codon:yes gene_type:complete